VFNGYINSETQPLVRGGRFDGMQSQTQTLREATGFSVDVSRLLAHTQLNAPTVVLVDFAALSNADKDQMQMLSEQVKSLRQQGYRVTMPLDTQDSPIDVTHRLSLTDSQWHLQTV
jgi:ATP phosphoribosyltransferase regulatory subunit